METPSLNPHRYDNIHLKSHSREIQQIINEIKTNIKVKYTAKTYTDIIIIIDKLFNYNLLNCINDAESLIHILIDKYPTNPRNYIMTLASIHMHSPTYKEIITPESTEIYQYHMTQINKFGKLSNIYVFEWKYLVSRLKEFTKGTLEYILYLLYTMLPPVRDNYGNVKIYTIHNCDDESNQYITSTKQLFIKNYKTVKTYSTLILNLPEKIYTEIDYSLEIFPRSFLIVQPNGQQYANGKLSTLIKQSFGISINNFRHSFASFIHYFSYKFSIEETIFMHKVMGHSANLALQYARDIYIGHSFNLEFVQSRYNGDDPTLLLESVCQKISD